ncbi:MAG TPA: SCO family protein [Terracidiphilus sp.]|nr:SCO family protein [Terracidiphilus sp.]
MKRIFLASACFLLAAQAWATKQHSAQGILLEVNPSHQSIVVSCDAIPGYMDAMVMPFTVRGQADFKSLVPGATVRFDMVETKAAAYAEHLQVVEVTNHEAEPTEAGRLTFLHQAMDPTAAAKIVQVGQPVPDFTLTDQANETTHLSQFKGKVVALTFAYSRCPNPNYCFRLSNNLSILERRFRSQVAGNLILITIVIDPDNDQGKALARFADTWKADPRAWRFLTGNLDDVRNIAELFGMGFWSDEGFLTHAFHTVVIDREGKLAANLEGNQFTAKQLGDLVATVMRQPVDRASAAAGSSLP